MKNNIDKNFIKENCNHCHRCRKNCSFLKKYEMDIGDVDKIEELAYHCFLCGKCTDVCNSNIDGRNFILKIREEKIKNDKNALNENSYKFLLLEKKNYLFKNYKHIGKRKAVLYTGCNFCSFYPKTTKKIIDVLKKYDIGVVFDCCTKPVLELGLKGDSDSAIEKMHENFLKNNIKEIIMLCPNCYYFLKDKFNGINVISIYDKLEELKLGNRNIEDGKIFLPCPDRNEKGLLEKVEKYFNKNFDIINNINCCGLGGCAIIKEKELAKEMSKSLNDIKGNIYTYCATCSGNFTRAGNVNAIHILTKIFDTNEKADTKKSLFNRMKFKFI